MARRRKNNMRPSALETTVGQFSMLRITAYSHVMSRNIDRKLSPTTTQGSKLHSDCGGSEHTSTHAVRSSGTSHAKRFYANIVNATAPLCPFAGSNTELHPPLGIVAGHLHKDPALEALDSCIILPRCQLKPQSLKFFCGNLGASQRPRH